MQWHTSRTRAKGDTVKYDSIAEAITDNIAAFLLGWVVGAGLFPMLVEQISQAF